MKSLCSKLMAFAVVGVFITAPKLASAAYFLIDDTSPDETITVSLNDFEAGFYINNFLVQQGLQNPASVTMLESGGLFTFSGSWIDNGGASGSYHVLFVEPYDQTIVSDILNVEYTTAAGFGTINGDFVSDIENNLGLVSDYAGLGYSTWIENPDGYYFSTAYLTAGAISDAEPVPEPTTMFLLGTGLVGVAGAASRKKKNQA